MDSDRLWNALTDANFWTAIGALATVGAIGAIVLTARQLQFDAWVKAQEIWTDDDFTNARGRLFRFLRNGDATWQQQDQDDSRLVCRKTDEFARIVPYLALTKGGGVRRVLKVWADPIAKSWAILKPFVLSEREETNWSSKWDAFEALGEKAVHRLSVDQRMLMLEARKRVQSSIRSSSVSVTSATPSDPPAQPASGD